ncbi:MAG: 50S ribosomal protein L6 [Patescibacteria group bacterium]
MSRIGKQIITIPAGVTVGATVSSEGTTVMVKGPQGELARTFRPSVTITASEGKVALTISPKQVATDGALWGTYASHVKNMVAGAASGFSKQLLIEGIGYKGNVSAQTLTLNVGFSHPVVVVAPAGVKIILEKNLLTVSGPNKEAVGQFAATVRAVKPPDPYKEKGIRYATEVVSRKQGKKVVA